MIDPVEAMMFVAPVPVLVARAVALIVDTEGALEVQVTRLVTFCVEPPVKVPVAVNCCVVPSGMDALAGETDRASSTAGEIVSVVFPDTVAEDAVMVADPTTSAEASPPEEIVVTPVADDFQVTDEVRFSVLPSEYFPVAVNCCVVPNGTAALAGVTAIDTRVARRRAASSSEIIGGLSSVMRVTFGAPIGAAMNGPSGPGRAWVTETCAAETCTVAQIKNRAVANSGKVI